MVGLILGLLIGTVGLWLFTDDDTRDLPEDSCEAVTTISRSRMRNFEETVSMGFAGEDDTAATSLSRCFEKVGSP
jgi:hypothetical protein